MSQPETGQPYVIINKKSGTVIDLSGEDNQSIIGYNYHGGDNQKVWPSVTLPILHPSDLNFSAVGFVPGRPYHLGDP